MLLDRFNLDGKVAVVTGAGRGIGEGCALAFGEVGAHVVCSARTLSEVENTAEKIRALGPEALAVTCDVNAADERQAVIEAAIERFGRIDVLVNNAGGSPPRPALDTSEAMFEKAFRFNVTSAFEMTKLCVPHMLQNDGGSIVNISSAAGRLAQSGFAAYGTAKAGLSALTRMLGAEFAPRVRVNAIAVGSVETSALTRMLGAEFAPRVRVNAIAVGSVETSALTPFLSDDLRGKMEALTPMRSLGQVEDIALAALYLGTPASRWVTGKIFEVDGGTEATNWPFEAPEL